MFGKTEFSKPERMFLLVTLSKSGLHVKQTKIQNYSLSHWRPWRLNSRPNFLNNPGGFFFGEIWREKGRKYKKRQMKHLIHIFEKNR